MRWRNRTTASAVAVAGLALVGCAGGDEGKIEQADLPQLVLRDSDVPPNFSRFDFGRLMLTDARPGPRLDERRFGRIDGWKARYRRSGRPTARGPLIVESRVDLFEEPEGAERDLEAYRSELKAFLETRGIDGRRLRAPDLGDEAAAVTFAQGSSTSRIRVYLIAWRERNATASVATTGFDRRTGLGDAVDLARKQQDRLAAAGN